MSVKPAIREFFLETALAACQSQQSSVCHFHDHAALAWTARLRNRGPAHRSLGGVKLHT